MIFYQILFWVYKNNSRSFLQQGSVKSNINVDNILILEYLKQALTLGTYQQITT